MKSVISSFSMTLDQAMRLKEATRNVKNRSAWINSAIDAKIKQMNAFDMNDISTGVIVNALHARVCGCHETLICPDYRVLSEMRWRKTNTGGDFPV